MLVLALLLLVLLLVAVETCRCRCLSLDMLRLLLFVVSVGDDVVWLLMAVRVVLLFVVAACRFVCCLFVEFGCAVWLYLLACVACCGCRCC